MERGIETGDLRHLRYRGTKATDSGERMWLVQRRERHQRLQRRHHTVINRNRLRIDGAAVNDPVSDPIKTGRAAEIGAKPFVDGADRGLMVVAGYRLISEFATLGVGDLDPCRGPDRGHLTLHAGRQSVICAAAQG